MQKIVAMVPEHMLDDVMNAVIALHVRCHMTASPVRYADGATSHLQQYRGASYRRPWEMREKLEVVVSDKEADAVLGMLAALLDRDRSRDEALLVSEVPDALRIRTGRRGEFAF
jgi:nitrogen regulatory protein P-II 1